MKINYHQIVFPLWCLVLIVLGSFPSALQAVSVSNSVAVQAVTGGQNGASGQNGADGQDGTRGLDGQSVTTGSTATYSEVLSIVNGVMTAVTERSATSSSVSVVNNMATTNARVVTTGSAQANKVVLSDEQRYEQLSELLASIQLILLSYVTHIF